MLRRLCVAAAAAQFGGALPCVPSRRRAVPSLNVETTVAMTTAEAKEAFAAASKAAGSYKAPGKT